MEKYDAYLELMRENAELRRLNLKLQENMEITKEVIDRFVAPDMYRNAMEWFEKVFELKRENNDD